MREELLNKIKRLRKQLHQCAEISGQEVKTKETLIRFLKEFTNFEINPCGRGFYVACRSEGRKNRGIVLRADYDALARPDGTAAHLCGHDGHAAVLCGVAMILEEQKPDRDVFLLFQPAEETGEGAFPCTEIFQKESIEEIYGMHNLPGFSKGQVYIKEGTFACGSEGLILSFQGAAAHAAYPEYGISPALAVGKFLCALPEISNQKFYESMTLCTVIGVSMGEKAFGAAAADAQVWLTLRAEKNKDLENLKEKVVHYARNVAKEENLKFKIKEQDVFPATENNEECVKKVLQCCNGQSLKEPMRWSEDFGHYLKRCKGVFFGIGAGEDCPALHTQFYEYPDCILRQSIEAFCRLIFE